MRAPFACALLALAAGAFAAEEVGRGDDEDALECPKGTRRVATNMKVEPFKCVPEADALRGGPYIPMTPTFKIGPKCPKGFEAEPTPGQLSRFRCVPKQGRGGPIEPDAIAPRRAAPAEAPAAAGGFRAPSRYARYEIKGALQFEHPLGWHIEDGWTDEVPTVYVEYDTRRQGRQVTLVISKIARGQTGFEDMDTAIAKEIEYQNSADAGSGRVGGFPARFTRLAEQTRTAYVRISDESYYTATYSAPDDLFKTFEPVFERLLSSLRFARQSVRDAR